MFNMDDNNRTTSFYVFKLNLLNVQFRKDHISHILTNTLFHINAIKKLPSMLEKSNSGINFTAPKM